MSWTVVRAVGSDTATGVLAYMMRCDRRKARSTVNKIEKFIRVDAHRHRRSDGDRP